MHRFYCPELLPDESAPPKTSFTPQDGSGDSADQQPILPDSVVQLNDTESHHASRVLRLKAGEAVELINGRGLLAVGMIEQVKPKVSVRISSSELQAAEPCALCIAVCIPKGGHADDMINQLSQLGVARLTPLLAERSTVQPRDKKIERLDRIAITAAKQCGRLHLMQIDQPTSFAEFILRDSDLKLLTDPNGSDLAVDSEKLTKHRKVSVLIGPEGGFTDDERKQAIEAGFEPWKINRLILRIESAAAAAASIIQHMQLAGPSA